MTLQASGVISISDVNVEVGNPATYTNNLSFLNGLVVAAERPASPNLGAFYSKAYYQATVDGNCNNGNEVNCACDCGNINCTNCVITGAVVCANCDTQSWLQSNCNCACTYNCTISTVSWNCNCACSKIICTKLHELGLLPDAIFAADQMYGDWLEKNDPKTYVGYISWAKVVTDCMSGTGGDFVFWNWNDESRRAYQTERTIHYAQLIATPWAEHMAFLMGVKKEDNSLGRGVMQIGKFFSRLAFILPKSDKTGFVRTWTILITCMVSYRLAQAYAAVCDFKRLKEQSA